MKLKVLRFSSQEDSTSGLLFLKEDDKLKFLCYTLEDEHRDVKIKTETRIPSGSYEIILRKHGGFHEKYSKRFSDIHRGMLHIIDVPGFDYILLHCGNTDEHTAGCLLVGDTQSNNIINKNGFVGQSSQCYKRIYPPIVSALEKGDKVTITYIDFD